MGWVIANGYGKPVNFEVNHREDLNKGGMNEFLAETRDAAERALSLI